MENFTDFFFWWSVVSTMLGVTFLVINVGQLVAYLKEQSLLLKEKDIHKSQVKVWQHHAYGIQMGLFVLTTGKFSTVEDLIASLRALHQDAQALYHSLNEERLFTDEEIKERQIKKEEESNRRLASLEQNRGI